MVSQSGFEEEKVRGLILRHESGFSADEARTLERLLKDVNICDPACGSGAFLVGMLNEIVNTRLVLDPAGSEYGLKKETIENCIYGVDIDPGAVEIAKLRLWLSLVVDYELADIEPLPNLDYKIMCGNSLLEELIVGDESIPLFDASVLKKDKPKRKSSDKLMQIDFLKQDADEYLKILRKLHVEYFHETDTQKKKMLRSRIEKIEMDFIQASVDSRVKAIETQIRNLNMQKPEDRKKNVELMTKKLEYLAIPNEIRKSKVRPYFLWHLNFFEVFQEKGGFDVVIANPPYVDSERMTKEMPEVRDILSKKYVTAKGNWDLYIPFWELGMNIISGSGKATFITPNKWLSIKYGTELRKLLKEHIYQIGNCDSIKVFEAGNSPVIIFAQKGHSTKVSVDIFDENFLTAKLASFLTEIITDFNWGWMLSEEVNLILRISHFGKGKKYYRCENPFTVSEAYQVKEILDDIKSADKYDSEKHFIFINTGTIERYYSLWGKKHTAYLKDKYLFPIIEKGKFKKNFPKRYAQISEPKIIISGIRHFECVLDRHGNIVAGKSTEILKNTSKVDDRGHP